MATSPIYNWPEPDNTDLVKNGALAIRTLGNAIDTTMATMVPKTIVDAKGDLIAGTAADTAARLAVGNNGETLVADSSTATGLRYQGSQAAGRNFAIGGGFDIWQRGTSFTSFPATNTYTADRWQAYRGGFASGMTITRQSTNDTTNLPFIQYCARVSRDSGNTSTQTLNFQTSIESANTYPLTGRTFVMSFYARAGANFSPTSSVLAATVLSSTSADVNYTSMPTQVATTNATLTTTWQRFSFTGTFGATAISAGLGFVMTPTGTAGANDYFEVTGVQIELGSVATTFTRAGGTIQGELAACQRYYYRKNSEVTGGAIGLCQAISTTIAQLILPHPVTMRTTPSIARSGLSLYNATQSRQAVSAIANNGSTLNTFSADITAANLVAGNASGLVGSGTSTTDYIEASAEL